ncbi:Proteasome activator BLM10 [Friedmanniomyces endolithicus]|nr:Proteasome activator BLM10 [Friedmanniomyces endolithicus]KAK0808942.1 Proteasome activator BLM10 [Friedmanniomyces endolithicus]KAK0809664.1 Proteasome activator BLM10 [Friedmanniomyces endolithicus]KAK0819503.1 Proteasome activator BLM10 [Friedmanniomyces endolithicus]KAK0905536.1 Proteasome activator BLM10 [Friedmanniomyces endolithicus]
MADDGPQHDRISDLLNGQHHHHHAHGGGQDDSRATSPGGGPYRSAEGDADGEEDISRLGRTRPRVFPYTKYLPYETETREQREADLDEMIKYLYIAVASGDFIPGAIHWTKEIRGWMSLKFDLTRRQRISLVKLYYELALAPGLEHSVAERFASMFMVLTKRKHYLRPGKDLILDWRPLYKELKVFVLPSESATQNTYSAKRNIRTLTKLCTFAQLFFDPKELPAMLEEFLPYYSMSFSEQAFVVLGLFNLMLPTSPPPADDEKLQPQYYLPTFFHLWSTINRSMVVDTRMLDIFSRQARDCLGAEQVPFGSCGLFTEEQSSLIFTAVLRLLEIPVGQATTPYSATVDVGAGNAILLDRDQRKHPVSHSIARWIIMSMSPQCLQATNKKSTLHQLEGLIQGIETFFHPSNSGAWTKLLAQLVYYLADFFVMRWNREQNGEYEIPADRKLNDELKRRFVLCLRDVVFMGIYAKSGTAMNYSLSTLQSLAYLEPNLILPGALQRIYPAMQGLVEVHRTISSIRALQMLSKIIARTKGYRCHLTTLLGLALPGIDANDLDKTMHSLAFIQAVCYNIPLHDLTKAPKLERSELNGDYEMVEANSPPALTDGTGTALAVDWITGQVARFEQEGPGIELDYSTELTPEDEETILKSSTAGFAEFIISFTGRVFTLLQNLPDAARVKSGSPEENVVNTLPATFSPLLASLSPELYNLALEQIAKFAANHVVHQARDAMAFICNAMVKISPKKALHRLLPDLISSIRTEITENGAGSTRTTGSEILPRDRALVWHVSLVSMCVVHVGADVLDFQEELFALAGFMQEKCQGIPLVHVSNFVHHLLLNLTVTYTIDFGLFNRAELEHGLGVESWGKLVKPGEVDIFWHVPKKEELEFAARIAEAQGGRALRCLEELIAEGDGVVGRKRDGVGKEWSDEVARNLVLLRLVISGVSRLFRSEDGTITPFTFVGKAGEGEDGVVSEVPTPEEEGPEGEGDSDPFNLPEDGKVKRSFRYPTGYPLEIGSPAYHAVHQLRRHAGETLHAVHEFLVKHQEDDVPCFNALYTAYRSWFVDMGIERSAHVLDRLTRLLAADIHPFKFAGTRKEYPRPLLVRRANLYHFQRLRFNEHPRAASELDKLLLLDLAASSTSVYTDIRRTAQSAGEQAVKSIVGAKTLIIPILLDALEDALQKGSQPRIKGAVFALLFGSLAKTVGRRWGDFAPRMVRLFIRVGEEDRPGIQKLVAGCGFVFQEMVQAGMRMVIMDQEILRGIWPEGEGGGLVVRTIARTRADADAVVPQIKGRLLKRRGVVEGKKKELAVELLKEVRTAHWKKASRMAVMIIGLDYRFETVASDGVVELATRGVIDTHPTLRALYTGSVSAVFSLSQGRALLGHKYENYLLGVQNDPDEVTLPTQREDPGWTQKYLDAFAHPEAEAYIDADYPGWLVWQDSMRGSQTGETKLEYDEVEMRVRRTMGAIIDRHWLSTLFGYMKQEPRDSAADRFRVSSSMMVAYAMELMAHGLTPATWGDFKDLALAVFGDGGDKHQHRAMAEIMGAMLSTAEEHAPHFREEVWAFAFPIVRRVFSDGLTPENMSYWSTFLTLVVGGKDPRRAWPLVEWLAGYRLDMQSHAAFKDSSKIMLLQIVVGVIGWHFQLTGPVVEDFVKHLDHPYKGVREVMGTTLATVFRTRYHESWKDVGTLLEAQSKAGSVGARAYVPSKEYSGIVDDVFDRLEKWRVERTPGTQTPTPYTQASKTVLLWLDTTLSAYDCTVLVPFFPGKVMKQLLFMMDIKEDPELQSLAYHVFRHLPNIPHQVGGSSGGDDEAEAFVRALIEIAKGSVSWHQRLRVLINIQVFYFRQLFLMPEAQAKELVGCVRDMLHDTQLEVRLGAAATLGGMVRCSPREFRDATIVELKKHFTNLLIKNPLPKRPRGGAVARDSTGTSTPTAEGNKLVLTRHAAVLGLGALVQAFPYVSPPPAWLPEVLATLAGRAASDGGMVGKSVKSVLSESKKTRQDTWHVDVKAFKPEQLEDLEGVLWKGYFA